MTTTTQCSSEEMYKTSLPIICSNSPSPRLFVLISPIILILGIFALILFAAPGTASAQNSPPTAVAGAVTGQDDETVNGGRRVWLFAGDSEDPDGDTLTYSWQQTAGPTVTINADPFGDAEFNYFTAPGAKSTTTTLTFRLTANDGQATSTADVTVTVRTAAGSPVTNVAAAPVTGTSSQIEVTWDAVTDAQSYWVQWKSGTQEYDGVLRHDVVDAPATSHIIYGLNGSTQYTIRIIALNAADFASEPSAEATATTPALPAGYENPPAKVIRISLWPEASLTHESFSLFWRRPVGVGTDAAIHYLIQWKSGTQDYAASRQVIMSNTDCTSLYANNSCNRIIDGLDSETEYRFRVFSVIGSFDAVTNQFVPSSDTSAPSLELVVTTRPAQPAPANLAATAPSATQIEVTWDAATNADSYHLQWRLSSETDDDYDTTREAFPSAATAPGYRITGLTPETAYTLRVRTQVDVDGDGIYEDAAYATTTVTTPALDPNVIEPPGRMGQIYVFPPTSLKPDGLHLFWYVLDDADAYYIQWKSGTQDYDASRQEYSFFCTSDFTTFCTKSIDGLDSETDYKFRVTAVKGSFDAANQFVPSSDPGSPSPELDVTTPAWPVAAPTNVAAMASATYIEVTWDPVAAMVVNQDYYYLQWRLSSETDNDYDSAREVFPLATATPGWTITGLTPETAYTVRVKARVVEDGTLEESAFSVVTATTRALAAGEVEPPGRVSHVSALSYMTDGIEVTWTSAVYADGYIVQWKSGNQEYSDTERRAVIDCGTACGSIDNRKYTITGLVSGTDYEVRVIATRTGTANAAPSYGLTISTRLERPEGFEVTAGIEELRLVWNEVAGAQNYRVQYISGTERFDQDPPEHTEITVTEPHYTIVGDPGVRYGVRVAGWRRGLRGAFAGPLSATPYGLPSAPRNLTLTPGDGKITVTWDPPADSGYPPEIRWYQVSYRPSGATTWSQPVARSWLQVPTRAVIEGLTNGQSYDVRVSVFTRTGKTAVGPKTATPQGPPPFDPDAPRVPGAPQNLTLKAGNGWIVVSWDAPEDAGIPPLHGYSIHYREAIGYREAEADTSTALWHGDLEINAKTITGLTNGKRYEVWVEAVNNQDEGPRSGPPTGLKRATPQEVGASAGPPYPERQPTAPRNLTLTAGDGEITVSWDPPSRLNNPAARYLVEFRKAGAKRWTDYGLESSPTTIDYLDNGTTYEVQVTVFDTYGDATAGPRSATPAKESAGGDNQAAGDDDNEGDGGDNQAARDDDNGGDGDNQAAGDDDNEGDGDNQAARDDDNGGDGGDNQAARDDDNGGDGDADERRPPSAPRNLKLVAGDGLIKVSWQEPRDMGELEDWIGYIVEVREVGESEWFEWDFYNGHQRDHRLPGQRSGLRSSGKSLQHVGRRRDRAEDRHPRPERCQWRRRQRQLSGGQRSGPPHRAGEDPDLRHLRRRRRPQVGHACQEKGRWHAGQRHARRAV